MHNFSLCVPCIALPGMLLSALDVGLLVVYVFISATVGLYSARQASTVPVSREGYFLAGRTANRWTTGISLLSGLSSGISFLGIPGFAFGHGIMQMWQVLSFILVTMAVAVMTVPFFQRGGFVTSYAYLEARFSVSIRTAAAVAFVLRIAFYLALVLYAPALAVSAVVGLSIYVSITLCGVLATLYTMKGGMTAAIATDFTVLTLILARCFALACPERCAWRQVGVGDHAGTRWQRDRLPMRPRIRTTMMLSIIRVPAPVGTRTTSRTCGRWHLVTCSTVSARMV